MATALGSAVSGAVAAGTPELILEGVADAGGSVAVQIASDLHLEFYSCPAEDAWREEELDRMIVPRAPVLALLGDIGIPTHPVYRSFLLRQAERFEAVLVITGNHEFYDSDPPAEVAPPPTSSWSRASEPPPPPR